MLKMFIIFYLRPQCMFMAFDFLRKLLNLLYQIMIYNISLFIIFVNGYLSIINEYTEIILKSLYPAYLIKLPVQNNKCIHIYNKFSYAVHTCFIRTYLPFVFSVNNINLRVKLIIN